MRWSDIHVFGCFSPSHQICNLILIQLRHATKHKMRLVVYNCRLMIIPYSSHICAGCCHTTRRRNPHQDRRITCRRHGYRKTRKLALLRFNISLFISFLQFAIGTLMDDYLGLVSWTKFYCVFLLHQRCILSRLCKARRFCLSEEKFE